jgi:hypothetical protein
MERSCESRIRTAESGIDDSTTLEAEVWRPTEVGRQSVGRKRLRGAAARVEKSDFAVPL